MSLGTTGAARSTLVSLRQALGVSGVALVELSWSDEEMGEGVAEDEETLFQPLESWRDVPSTEVFGVHLKACLKVILSLFVCFSFFLLSDWPLWL